MNDIDWGFWTGMDLARWGWRHPVTLAIAPCLILAIWAFVTLRKGR